MSMTNQAIEAAARACWMLCRTIPGHAGPTPSVEQFAAELAKHFSAPSERLKGLVKKWRELAGNSTLSRACVLRGCASELEGALEAVLAEPSDELPMVLGRVPCIAASASRGWYIYDLNDQFVQLRTSREWANPSEEPFGIYYWPSYAAAVAFLRECAAQASEPQQAGERAAIRSVNDLVKCYAKIIDDAKAALENIVCVNDPDRGVVLLSNYGPTHYDAEAKCQVYDHENFSPLGDSLIALHDILSGSSPPSPAPAAPQAEPK